MSPPQVQSTPVSFPPTMHPLWARHTHGCTSRRESAKPRERAHSALRRLSPAVAVLAPPAPGRSPRRWTPVPSPVVAPAPTTLPAVLPTLPATMPAALLGVGRNVIRQGLDSSLDGHG